MGLVDGASGPGVKWLGAPLVGSRALVDLGPGAGACFVTPRRWVRVCLLLAALRGVFLDRQLRAGHDSAAEVRATGGTLEGGRRDLGLARPGARVGLGLLGAATCARCSCLCVSTPNLLL